MFESGIHLASLITKDKDGSLYCVYSFICHVKNHLPPSKYEDPVFFKGGDQSSPTTELRFELVMQSLFTVAKLFSLDLEARE